MNTKNKTIALIEIAIVLCSLFLVAIPAVAAEQNQAMQKVSASTITTSSEDDYVLDIYGNANEDDTIDMGDVVYTKLAIFGKKPKTELCDAKYDGRINVLDVIQTKLIILGKEKELTVVDSTNRIVTIHKPVERIVSVFPPATRMVLSLGAADKLVGLGNHRYVVNHYQRVGLHAPKWEKVVGELRKVPEVGLYSDVELVLSLKPDLVITWEHRPEYKVLQDAGIPVVGVYMGGACRVTRGFEQLMLLGYLLDKEERAEEIIAYFDEIVSDVTKITETIPEEKKPRVYPCHFSLTRAFVRYSTVELAGGSLVSKGCAPPTFAGSVTDIEKEQILTWNPDIILIPTGVATLKLKVEDVLSDHVLQEVTAVKEGRVYYTVAASGISYSDVPLQITELLTQAKLFHPDKFEELDLEKEANELFKVYYGVDGLRTESIELYKEKWGFDPWSDLRKK